MTAVTLSLQSCHNHRQQLEQARLQGELSAIYAADHLTGFDENNTNSILDLIDSFAAKQQNRITVYTSYIIENNVQQYYSRLDFKYKMYKGLFQSLYDYRQHPVLNFQNFVCSFNGSAHISRKLLVAILKRFEYYKPEYVSKNFTFSIDQLDGHLVDLVGQKNNFYRKFFIADNSATFFDTINNFEYRRFDHASNISNLEHKLTGSFLHLVSETMATSYHPFVTEKFLYSVVTRGLFLAYAQPGWHAHLENYYGFKRYTKLFDYRFDSIQNPVERLVELVTMISKFSFLSSDDWKELYLLQQDEIEYNYDHYFSGRYLTHLKQYE